MEYDDHEDNDIDNFKIGDNDSMSDHDNSSSMCLSKGSTTRKLSKIEKKI